MKNAQELNSESTPSGDSLDPTGAATRRPMPFRRKFAFTLLLFMFVSLGLEVAARVGSFVYYGFNPYYLVYGFKAWKTDDGHSVKYRGYFKFPADSVIKFGTPEPARINNHGFRGEDFDAAKPPGTFRIVCLGASSTFGYRNVDAGTYPAILQRIIRAKRPDLKVEVLNCGIPHMNTDHIVAMFRHEVLDYQPDVVTFYEGYNDATWPLDATQLERFQSWMDEYSAAYAAVRKGISALGGRLHGRWSKYLPKIDASTVKKQLELHRGMTDANLSSLLQLASEKGIHPVLIKQALRRPEDLDKSPPPTYQAAYDSIRRELEENGAISGSDMAMYIHFDLMRLVEELASRFQAALVDNIAMVDDHPEGLLTQVHLSQEANARLAEAIYAAVEPLLPPVR